MSNGNRISIRIGGKRLLMLATLPALVLILLLSTTGALAGKLTDTSAGVTGLSKQSSATSSTSGASTPGQAGSLSTRDLSKLNNMEQAASAPSTASGAKSAPNANNPNANNPSVPLDDAYMFFAVNGSNCTSPLANPLLGVNGTVPTTDRRYKADGPIPYRRDNSVNTKSLS